MKSNIYKSWKLLLPWKKLTKTDNIDYVNDQRWNYIGQMQLVPTRNHNTG